MPHCKRRGTARRRGHGSRQKPCVTQCFLGGLVVLGRTAPGDSACALIKLRGVDAIDALRQGVLDVSAIDQFGHTPQQGVLSGDGGGGEHGAPAPPHLICAHRGQLTPAIKAMSAFLRKRFDWSAGRPFFERANVQPLRRLSLQARPCLVALEIS